MKYKVNLKFLIILIIITAGIKPKVILDDKYRYIPVQIISCSTGWSIHWGKLIRGKGLLGIHGIKSAAEATRKSTSDLMEDFPGISKNHAEEISKELIMKVCINN